MNQEERLIELESKITYLENYISDINSVVIEQEKIIKKIIVVTEELKKQIMTNKDGLPEVEKPPHY